MSVLSPAWNNSAPTARIFMKLDRDWEVGICSRKPQHFLLYTHTHTHTPDIRSSYFPKDSVQVGIDSTYFMWSMTCVHIRESRWNPNSNTTEPDRPHHDCPIACFIAQQYSSAKFVSLRFSLRKEKSGAPFKNFFFFCSKCFCIIWNVTTEQIFFIF